MIVFWIVATLLAIGALLLLLPPLLRPKGDSVNSGGVNVAVHRDQLREAERDLANDLITAERFEQARAEIQSRVLEDTAAATPAAAAAAAAPRPSRAAAIALALLIPIGSLLTYQWLGTPDGVAPALAAAAASDGQARHSITPEQIEKMVSALAERLKAEPNNAEGWMMLGRSYTALGRYADAAIAMRRAVALTPADPSLLADFADVLGMAQGKRLSGEPAKLVQQALDLDPRHVKALALAGSVAFEAKDYAAARRYWERLVVLVPPDSPMARSVQDSIAEATQLDSGTAATVRAAAPPASATTAAAATSKLSGTVQLSPALASQVAAGDTLFVFARAVEGPRMPLAIVRRSATLPSEFTLDDSMAMTPATRLSGASRVIVGARISRSGNATPQSGDLIGQSEPVAVTASGVRITINSVQP